MTEPCEANVGLARAHDLMRDLVRPLELERVPVPAAGGRVLGDAVRARIDAPRGDVSAMDGFALRDDEIRAGRREFDVVGATYAGDSAAALRVPGSAVRVMTGAMVPVGADRVVPFELVEERGRRISLPGEFPAAAHVRARGSDFLEGQVLLHPGTLLDPVRLLVTAASDQAAIRVHRRPTLHLIASGDELVTPGAAARSREGVPDSLSDALLLFAREWGAVPLGKTRVQDDAGEMSGAARRAIAENDVVVLAGGAASGDRDLARPVLSALGLDLGFAGVSMKPGKPVWYGRIGTTHVLGLPGNPGAAMLVARLFLAPLLAALSGRGFDRALDWRPAFLARSLGRCGPRETFLYGRRDGGDVDVVEQQSSAAQASLATADVIVRRPAEAEEATRGSIVPVLDL